MNFSATKKILVASTMGLLSLSAHVQADDSLFSSCTNAWMQKSNDFADKVDFKNFGEKYCGCVATKPLSSKEEIQKAMQLCMSRTLLHDTMDSVEEEVGLSDAKDKDLMEYCEDRWNLVYPKQTNEDKKITTAYCECAKPKLMNLTKQTTKITDKQYDEGIDSIAAECSGNVKQEAPPTSAPESNATTPTTTH